MSDSITFKYTLTEEDIVRAVREATSMKKWAWVIWGALTIMMVVGTRSAIGRMLESGLSAGAIILLLWVTVLPGHLFWWVRFGRPRRTARSDPNVGVETETTVSANGIATRNDLENQEAAWAAFTHVIEVRDMFLLYLGEIDFTPMPKRCFEDTEVIDCFREFVRANVADFRQG